MNNSDNSLLSVSVITAVLNRGKVIERCIKSVIAQTYRNIEYIVVDGGSTDGTLEIVHRYEEKISRIVSEKDKGVYDAMNKGYRLSHGDFILMLNSDDFLVPEAIELSVNAILEQRADYSGAPAYIIDENSVIKYVYWPDCFDKRAYIAQNPCAHETMLVSRKAYVDIGGYDTRFQIAADLKFELELISRDYKVARVEKPILYFTDGGMSSNEEKARKEVVEILSNYLPITKEHLEGLVLLVNRGIPSEHCLEVFSDQAMLHALPEEVISYLFTNLYYKYLRELNKNTDQKLFKRLLLKIKKIVKRLIKYEDSNMHDALPRRWVWKRKGSR